MQVEQHRLGLVAGLVTDRHDRRLPGRRHRTGHRAQPAIARVTGGSLQATWLLAEPLGIESCHGAGQIELAGQCGHKRRIGGSLGTQSVIDVGHVEVEPPRRRQCVQRMEQTNAVRATAHGDDDRGSSRRRQRK